ncbi:MAG: BtrH N-terminal domain-containing protein [Actinobacteria bacterium]|nr:BtrH N-terminal domain-containing protein [Actinomycetota bacterium]
MTREGVRKEYALARVLIEEFPHRPGGHCSSTALRDLLGFYGHDLTEEMVFGLGAGIGFIYFHHPDMKPPVYIGGRVFNLEEHLCKHLGIGMEVVSGMGADDGWLAVKEMLDQGVPTMVHADVYHLDYLRAKRHFGGHRIVLVGYDEEREVAFVADNDRDSICECSLASLARARSAAFLPQPADNTFYRFGVPERLTPLSRAIPPAVARAVRFNLHLPPERASFNCDGVEVVRGVPGLERFALAMGGWPDEMDEDTLSLLCKSIYVSAEKGGTGYGGNFRRLYGRFLNESAEVLSSPGLGRAGDEFIAIGDTWTSLSLTFKDLSSDGRRAVLLAEPIAREISGREHDAFTALESVSDSELQGKS